MHIFLSALEGARIPVAKRSTNGGMTYVSEMLIRRGVRMRYNLVSYFALDRDKGRMGNAVRIRDNSIEMLVDSGAHSFQKGKKVSWDEYTERYAQFIREFDRPNILGYFEMDVDKIIGLPKVAELRRRLERVTDKIIPVWHKGRGIADFRAMCESHRGRIVAITGFANEDIRDEQYIKFVAYARKCGCRIHCLGMTRKAVLDKVPFDYTDSSTWLQRVQYGMVLSDGRRATIEFCRNHRDVMYYHSYMNAMKEQAYYEEKWRKEHERGK